MSEIVVVEAEKVTCNKKIFYRITATTNGNIHSNHLQETIAKAIKHAKKTNQDRVELIYRYEDQNG